MEHLEKNNEGEEMEKRQKFLEFFGGQVPECIAVLSGGKKTAVFIFPALPHAQVFVL